MPMQRVERDPYASPAPTPARASLAAAPAPVAAAPAPAVVPVARQMQAREDLGFAAETTAARLARDAQKREAQQQAAIQAWARSQASQQSLMAENLRAQAAGIGQREDIAMLRNAAMGQGPSAAAVQAQQQAEQIAAQQYGLAASRGANPAAMRAAIMQGGQAQQSAAGQGALARAQEQMAARGQYAGAFGDASQQLLGAQMQAAGLQSQTGLGALGLSNQATATGQQGVQGGNEALMRALQFRYGMMRDPEEDAMRQAITQMQTDAQLQNTQMQIDAQPSFWEKLALGVAGAGAQGAGAAVTQSAMSGSKPLPV